MLNLRKKKQSIRSSNQPRQVNIDSLPTTRYYRSGSGPQDSRASSGRNTQKPNKKQLAPRESAKSAGKLEAFVRALPRRVLFIIIVALLLVNTTVSTFDIAFSSSAYSADFSPFQKRLETEYKAGIQSIFDSSVLYKNKLTLNSQGFELELEQKFPEIESSSVIVPLAGRELRVNIAPAIPILRYSSQNQYGVIVGNGVYVQISEDDYLSLTTLPVLSLQRDVAVSRGSQVLTSKEVSLLSLAAAELDGSTETRPEVISVLFDVERREIQLRFDGANYFAKLTPERESRGQIGALVATITGLSSSSSLPETFIDVRVEDRVFVK